VILTGDSTIFGRIAKLTSKRQPGRTILQQDIRRLVLVCVGTAVVISIIVVIVWASWLRRDHPEFLSTSGLIVAIVSVSVALIPEGTASRNTFNFSGLPITVTVSLTLAAMKLKRRKVLCKSLSTLETLGSINVLCADKTGTITENRMAVKNVAIMTDTMVPAQAHNAILTGDAPGLAWKQLWHVAALSCTVNLDSEGGSTIALDRTIGDATDIATLRFADALFPIKTLTGKWTPSLDIPFNSKNKVSNNADKH
jgi:sodium/potassium-transporting ATPase subunit alpha